MKYSKKKLYVFEHKENQYILDPEFLYDITFIF